MTINVLHIFIAFTLGMGLGLGYFGGLWLTVQSLPLVRHPALLTVSSFVGRTGVSLIGFSLVMDGHYWERVLVCLFGFLVMRSLLLRHLMPEHAPPTVTENV